MADSIEISTRILQRELYHARPPDLQTRQDMKPTLLISWWSTCFALAIILVRVLGRYIRTETLFREDKIMAVSILPLLVRMGLIHVVLLWGTNNTVTDSLADIDIQHRVTGSRLVLAARIFYAAFIWIAKLTVLEFLKRIIGSYWRKSFEIGLQAIRYFLLATFFGVVIATLTECKPFEKYWQVVPDPGPKCREGLAQLFTMGICDIITDLLLVIFPIPIILMSAMPLKRKISLILLFALSLALVGVTAYRIPSTVSRHGAQQFRSLLASLEILAAAGVSNSIVIGSFIRDRGVKKSRYRSQSIGGSSLDRPTTRNNLVTSKHWGSDMDLVSGVGMFLSPELQSIRSSGIQAPQPVPPAATNGGAADTGADDISSISSTSVYEKAKPQTPRLANEAPIADPAAHPPRKMSFFDVGSLIQKDESISAAPIHGSGRQIPTLNSESAPGAQRDTTTQSGATKAQREGSGPSAPSLSDMGGLLSSISPEPNPPPYTTR